MMSNTDIDNVLENIYRIYDYEIRAIFIPRLLCVNFYFENHAMSLSKDMLDKITTEQLVDIIFQQFQLEGYGVKSYEFLYDNVVNDECLFDSEIAQAFHDAAADWAYIV